MGILIFYAAGIATNLFGNPAFRMFWIISDETAYNVAAYAAIVAIALDLVILFIFLIKRRETAEAA